LKDNPLDLDFSPWTGSDLREFRVSLWSTLRERARHPSYLRCCPSSADMARRVGVHAERWRQWERDGVPSTGWSALLRVYRDEDFRDIAPINCSISALEAVAETLGNFTELSRALEVDRRTITKWRYSIGYVPGVQGYGRVVRLVFEDIILPVKGNQC
jgi:hypothetical protein